MDISRRELLILPAAAALANTVQAAPVRAAEPVQALPWSRKVRRVGQLNMTEHDPVALDVEAWADYWASLKVDVVLVSVTGILAFYQTKVPFHRRASISATATSSVTAAAPRRNAACASSLA